MDFNPFAILLDDVPEPSTEPPVPINTILEDIFGFTLDESHADQNNLFYLGEIAKSFDRKDLDLEVLQHALFERLFMSGAENVSNPENLHSHEPKVIVYLYQCFKNAALYDGLQENERNQLRALLIQNSATAFIQADLYQGQNLERQLMHVLKDPNQYSVDFFRSICRGILEEPDAGVTQLKVTLIKFLQLLTKDIVKFNLTSVDFSVFSILRIFTADEILADILIDAKPEKFTVGADYAETPIGALLNISILPRKPSLPHDYFLDVTDRAAVTAAENSLWGFTRTLNEEMYTMIRSLLILSPRIKDKMLEWIGQCLKANADRRKLWNSQSPPEFNPASYTNVSDGFMINLNTILLKLCQPFCSDFQDNKALKVDPTYTKVPNELHIEKDIHLPDLPNETCLIPFESGEEPQMAQTKYSFVTECFILTHKSVDLGYQVGVDKLIRMNQEIGRMERVHIDAMAQSSGNNDFADSIKTRLTDLITKYLSLKTTLGQPEFLSDMSDMCSTTCHWLSQVAVHSSCIGAPGTFAPLREIPITFPLSDDIPNQLKYIPEFFIENVVGHLVFMRRFSHMAYESHGYEKMKPILTLILVYMGSPERMRNPHLRARLAEALEGLLPYYKDEPETSNSISCYQREMLFLHHEHRSEIVVSLLKVFVSIEMTGQSVEFEQKFNYRRPMYTVMNYLWTKEDYRTYFKALAEETERNMEAVTPPLFLRFVNLLMNDAVFLLDEALTNMAKLREMQTARENGDWDSISATERAQNMGYMRHIGIIARFDNILGRDTIEMMQKLTSEITIVFTHATMVDRVAGMLNYFLYNLVGPKKKNFKVKDQKEFNFEPANTVLAICKIYVNLKENDSFCLAISQDGRSYSPQLFTLAEDVLIRIGGGVLIEEVRELAAKVARIAAQHQIKEEALADAPDHFLDPIMSTIMFDPVILPSSRQTVDRTTIARHLLSDQTDPFNRMPLSMDQVIPNTELLEEIKKWLDERSCQ